MYEKMDGQMTIALRSAICCSPTCSDTHENSTIDKQPAVCVNQDISSQVLTGHTTLEDETSNTSFDKPRLNREIELLANWKNGSNEHERSCDIRKEDGLQLRLGRNDDISKLDDEYINNKESTNAKVQLDRTSICSLEDQNGSMEENLKHKETKINKKETETFVVEHDVTSNRLSIESPDSTIERWKLAEPKDQDSKIGYILYPQLYNIYKATILSTEASGAVIRLHNFEHQALVPLSQVDACEIKKRDCQDNAKMKLLVHKGEEVWVKVISIKNENNDLKICCSMKLASQYDGRDLDPDNFLLGNKSKKVNNICVTQKSKNNVEHACMENYDSEKLECHIRYPQNHEELRDEGACGSCRDNTQYVSYKKPTNTTSLEKGKAHFLGIPGWSMRTSVGRGRAMVRPAWMTHGIGVGGESSTLVTNCEIPSGCSNSREHNTIEKTFQKEETSLNVLPVLPTICKRDENMIQKQRRKDKREGRRYNGKKDKHKRRHKEESEYFQDHRKRF